MSSGNTDFSVYDPSSTHALTPTRDFRACLITAPCLQPPHQKPLQLFRRPQPNVRRGFPRLLPYKNAEPTRAQRVDRPKRRLVGDVISKERDRTSFRPYRSKFCKNRLDCA